MGENRSTRTGRGKPEPRERVTRIVHEHISYAKQYPERLAEIASRLDITTEEALAVAIADQILEEFHLTETES